MATPNVRVDVREFKELARKARTAGPEIDKDMREGLKAAGKIGARTAKLMIHSWPVSGGISSRAGGRAHRGLRATLASQITVSVSSRNVTIRQGTRGLRGQNARDLPRDIDRGGWYHPVYGHLVHQSIRERAAHARRRQSLLAAIPRNGKVFQTGFPYFKAPIHAVQPEMEAEVSKVLDKLKHHLT